MTDCSSAQSKRDALRDLSTGAVHRMRRLTTLNGFGAPRPAAATEVQIIHRTRVRFQAGVMLAFVIASITTVNAATMSELGADFTANLRSAVATPDWASCGGSSTDSETTTAAKQLIDRIVCLAKTKPQTAKDLIEGLQANVDAVNFAALPLSQMQQHIDLRKYVTEAWEKIEFLNQRVITSSIVDHSSSPVQLKTCIEQHQLDDPQWLITASWRARSQSVSAIKLHVETENAFGDLLQSDDLTPTGAFSSDEDSHDVWTIGDLHMPPYANVAKVRCSIVSAILSDGSVWKASDPAKPHLRPLKDSKTKSTPLPALEPVPLLTTNPR